MTTVGERVRQLRKENGNMGQEELARRINVTGQTISRLERGETKEPDMATLKGIAGVFDISVDELLGNEDPALETLVQAGIAKRPTHAVELDASRAYDSDGNGVRKQAVLNLIKDRELRVLPEEIDVLEDLVDRLAAYKGLVEVQKMLRVLFIAYRADPAGFDNVPNSAFTYGPGQVEAGEAETRAAQERGAAKGHTPLIKNPRRS